MSTRLCAVCNGNFTGLLVINRRIPHHQSVAGFRRSAEEGCYICRSVSVKLQDMVSDGEDKDEDEDEDDDHDYYTEFTWYLPMPTAERRSVYGPYTEHGHLSIRFMKSHLIILFRLISTASPDAPIRSVDPGASLTDQAVMETARSWLKKCRQNHELCGPVDPAFNPTRLIYIHDESSVQLIETKKEVKSHAYVAFSHCWGKSEALKLLQDDLDKGTRGNIEELRSLIQVQSLPTSYREAISVSLALGFRHIWIDSLCIIQNSRDDWAKESAMMQDVYANSSLNLCASAAADSSKASFQRRDLGVYVPLKIEPRWTGILDGDHKKGKPGPLPSYLHRIKPKLVIYGMHEMEINNSPLNLRAWVVQERILSRRHLFMTNHQLWWECRDTLASEAFPAGNPESFNEEHEEDRVQYYALNPPGQHSPHHGAVLDGSLVGQTDRTRGRPARHPPYKQLSEDKMTYLWNCLVRHYSWCDLTYPHDKLPALSGLAQMFSVIRGPGFSLDGFSLDGNSYLAGIWRPELRRGLCWKSCSRGQFRSHRPDPYRAPSWSWASVEGPVTAAVSWARPFFCVVDAKVLHEDERYKAGTVKGGILHLRSRLLGPLSIRDGKSSYSGLTISPSQQVDSCVREAIDAAEWEISWDEGYVNLKKYCISYLDKLPHTVHQDGIVKGTDAVRKMVWLEDLAEEPRIRLFMVFITRCTDRYSHRVRSTGINEYVNGLMLCQVVNTSGLEGVDEGVVFQRVGYFTKRGTIHREVLDLIPERTIAII
ncbi:hypothetical protein NCU07502 [Neurospora crassa OR74A]|uniref:Heterokaryon incompatibility domain-containing protein n=1 Tax=Neurospora crassa (strain ATCC 24698 / 74-OR23-1A / CBS 708.71 / DSM 1257 / FGSC 987) TaxID=367110 RepID=Q7SG40_NEUCR|nr:hypothetical protein NCU07502 [Neurospora crassa OR74A]EAA35813.2 hypothetical protein NCU07502 [Neurospora crassa OR74A]|eukprot:XP_965049.2 hypothetical protein NCU07502 [Neurospora crassa OR74A]